VYGIDGGIYAQGTADFIVAMTEAMIQGFSTAGGMFAGFPEEKIVVGLPACPSAAGGGFCSPAVVAAAVDYLHGNGNAPGIYTLVHAQGYPQLGGMMTWSINWDAVATCNASAYEYASNYEHLFETVLAVDDQSTIEKSLLYPNPAQSFVQLGVSNANYFIVNTLGQVVKTGQSSPTGQIEIADIPDGFYSIRCLNMCYSFVKSVAY
jgi:chitinase